MDGLKLHFCMSEQRSRSKATGTKLDLDNIDTTNWQAMEL